MKKLICIFLLGTFLISCSNDDDQGNVDPFEQYQGNWAGSYTGGDNGTWSATIDSDGNVSGSATSNVFSQTYNLEGTVSSEGVFTATVGSATSGATFTGNIDGDNVTGTWINSSAGLSGNWSGVKQ